MNEISTNPLVECCK